MDEYVYQAYVKIAKNETTEDIEIPAEKDGTMLLSTVKAQFPDAVGLKYRSPTGGWRGLRVTENVLDPPMEGWGGVTYYIALPDITLKRKAAGDLNESSPVKSPKCWNNQYLRDIIVLGLPLTTTNTELKEYFEKTCGELVFNEIKLDRSTQKSRGFGFVRFKTVEAAKLALDGEHVLDGKLLNVNMSRKKEDQIKLFIGQLPTATNEETLRDYFGEFGDLDDVYIPSPFRGFGFVTFVSKEDGRSVIRKSHMIGSSRLNIRVAESRGEKPTNMGEPRSSPQGPTNYSWNAQGYQSRKDPGTGIPPHLRNMLQQYVNN